jgi:putative membrane protein
MSYLDDPRVLFAAERTLLAWNRTAVSLITLGFVIERFGLFIKVMHFSDVAGQRHLSFMIGLALIGFASFMSVFSVLQFKRVVKRLSPAEIPQGYMLWCGTAANTAVAVLGVLLIVYLMRGFGE